MTMIMAIESSCDETACAIVKDGREILSNIVSSQINVHTQFGGVVPEVASRIHVENISTVITEALHQAKMTMDDIDYCVCHQANIRIIQHVQKQYAGNEHKFFANIDKYGNTSAASIPIAIDELMEAGKLKSGMKVICVGFGAGLTWSSVLFEL